MIIVKCRIESSKIVQFEGVKKHPLNAPLKQKMRLPRRMLTHPPRNGEFLRLLRFDLPKARKGVRNGGCAQWRMIAPLRGCVSCSRGSLKVKLTFLFCHPALFPGTHYARFYFRVFSLEGTHFPLTPIKKKKQKMRLPRRMLTHPPRNGGCAQWRRRF